MISILDLPDEILCNIFQHLSRANDLQYSILVCHRFRNVLLSKHFAKHRINIIVEIIVRSVANENYPTGLFYLPSLIQKFFVGQISMAEWLEQSFLTLATDTLNKYYPQQIFQEFKRRRLESQLSHYLKKPDGEKSLIDGAILISMYGQLEDTAPSETSSLKTKCAISSIVQQIEQQFRKQRNILQDSNTLFQHLMDCVRTTIFGELGFTHQNTSVNNLFIDKVLESRTGANLTILIIYLEVSKTLGLICKPYYIRSRNSIALIIEDKNGKFWEISMMDGVLTEFTNVKVLPIPFNGILQMLMNAFYDLSNSKSRTPTSVKYCRLACVIFENSEVFVKRQGMRYKSYVQHYVRSSISTGLQLEYAMTMLEKVRLLPELKQVADNLLPQVNTALMNRQAKAERSKTATRRQPWVKFAVGQILNYRENRGTVDHPCVVVNWTPRSPSYMKTDNPYYDVLMVDGNEEIKLKVSQTRLNINPNPVQILHKDIGIHFKQYTGRFYIGHDAKQVHYPEDTHFLMSGAYLN